MHPESGQDLGTQKEFSRLYAPLDYLSIVGKRKRASTQKCMLAHLRVVICLMERADGTRFAI